jgi:hypothetical protein
LEVDARIDDSMVEVHPVASVSDPVHVRPKESAFLVRLRKESMLDEPRVARYLIGLENIAYLSNSRVEDVLKILREEESSAFDLESAELRFAPPIDRDDLRETALETLILSSLWQIVPKLDFYPTNVEVNCLPGICRLRLTSFEQTRLSNGGALRAALTVMMSEYTSSVRQNDQTHRSVDATAMELSDFYFVRRAPSN